MSGLFIAGFDTETNSFSPIPSGEAAFRDTLLAFGDATAQPLNSCSAQLALWRTRAAAIGLIVHEGLCAVAEPGGPIPREFYEALRERILGDLRDTEPEIVLLALHGAAIAQGYDDVEGDILERTRALLGPQVFIGATLDPHAHLTERMIAHADALIAYKEYPHTDILDRAAELFDLALATRSGSLRPVMAWWDCRMIASFPTQAEPMRGFVDALMAEERSDPAILSLSLIHGFAHGDVPEAGARMLAIADGRWDLARALAETHGHRFVSLRDRVTPQFLDMARATSLIADAPFAGAPFVLADTGDNPGGGGPGDATFLLQAALASGAKGVAFAMFWDPQLVHQCCRAGVGAVLDLRLGGRFDGISGTPAVLQGALVKAVRTDLRQRFGKVFLPVGVAVRLDVGGITIVASDRRTQVFDPVCFSGLGADPSSYRVLVVKSLNHFAALFGPLARAFHYVASPGATSPCYAQIPYRKRSLDYWPRTAHPWLSGKSP